MKQEKVFKSSPWKALFYALGSSLFVFGGVLMVDDRPLLSWVVILLFGALALAFLLLLVKGGASLRLDDEGFEMVGVFKRKRFRWKEIESISLAKIRGAQVIALDYKTGDTRGSRASRLLAGMDASIGDIYRVSLSDLCDVLNQWHERYRGPI